MEEFVPCIYIKADGTKIDFTGLYEINRNRDLKYFNYKGNKGKTHITNLDGLNQSGRYYKVTLVKDGIKYNCTVHRLMLSSFYPNTDIYECVDHLDGNTHNNSLDNIKFCLNSDNMSNEHRIKLVSHSLLNTTKMSKPTLQYSLDGELVKEWLSIGEIERTLGYFKTNISSCCLGKHKQAYGYIWKFK